MQVTTQNTANIFPLSVMDFATDQTDLMDRNGNVYPIVKAAGMGYSIGHKKMVWTDDGPMQGCCSAQIGKSNLIFHMFCLFLIGLVWSGSLRKLVPSQCQVSKF